jgi:quercetin dioxygenase-like cupin family protein
VKASIFSFVLCLLLVALAPAQSGRTEIDNDQVKVLKVTVEPHQKTPLHQHAVNRVMIYLQAGRQTLDYQDGKKVLLNWKAGEVKWSPAGGMHIAELTSDKPVTIVEVELKKPVASAKAGMSPLDPVKIDSSHYRVEFENDQVRVLHVKIGGKETAPMHEHVLNRVVVFLTDQRFRVTALEGKADSVTHKAGGVSWGGPAKHKEENLSDKAFEALVVELKG